MNYLGLFEVLGFDFTLESKKNFFLITEYLFKNIKYLESQYLLRKIFDEHLILENLNS